MEEVKDKPKRRPLVRAASEESSSDLSSVSFSPSPGDTLPWNLPRHHRIKRSKSASGDVLDPAERAVIRIAGTKFTQTEKGGQSVCWVDVWFLLLVPPHASVHLNSGGMMLPSVEGTVLKPPFFSISLGRHINVHTNRFIYHCVSLACAHLFPMAVRLVFFFKSLSKSSGEVLQLFHLCQLSQH